MAITQISSERSEFSEILHAKKDGADLKIVIDTTSYTLITGGVKCVSVLWLPDGRWLVYYITGTDTLNARRSLNASPQSSSEWETITP